ncbi:MAG: hypothetical protein IT437_07470, partial [Phycisphaerales bacterium]|nr:hypothetical protein [Phycisphaerales bacterium]
YDAWNRLLQVNAGHLSVETPPQVVVDGLVKHHSYDGLGRLACAQSPVAGGLRTERFYYDGIRRLQEVVTDPLDGDADAAMAGDPGALAALAAEPGLDGDAASAPSQASQAQAPAPPTTGLVREYVWGPGDNGVDELLAQYGPNREPTWVIQDAGLDVVALCDLGGSGGSARIAWQGVYDAYGSVLAAESLYAHAPLHAGHKGLFFDRLDAPLLDPITGLETPRLAPSSTLLAHIRNRAYLPSLGRWAQKDPNASGLALLGAARYFGARWDERPADLELDQAFGDGCNLYGYAGNNAFLNSDPLGLFFAGIGPTDVAMLGFELGRVAFNLIDAYAGDMEAHAAWSGDWGLADDLFAPKEDEEEGPDYLDAEMDAEAGIGEYRAGLAESINVGIKAARVLGKVRAGAIYHSYHAARYAIRTARAALQAHHIVEVRVLRALGKSLNGPAIAMTKAQHRLVTNLLRRNLPYGTRLDMSPDCLARIRAAYRKAYGAFPDLAERAMEILGP